MPPYPTLQPKDVPTLFMVLFFKPTFQMRWFDEENRVRSQGASSKREGAAVSR